MVYGDNPYSLSLRLRCEIPCKKCCQSCHESPKDRMVVIHKIVVLSCQEMQLFRLFRRRVEGERLVDWVQTVMFAMRDEQWARSDSSDVLLGV